MNRNALLIYNPMAGNGQFKAQLDTVIDGFQRKGFQLKLFRLNSFEELDKHLETITSETYGRIIAAGGDGTLHQIVNRLMQHQIYTPFGVYPVGTANDFSQHFGLPRSVEEMTEILTGDHYTWCDVGVANDQYFINIASFGSLVDISQRIDSRFKNSLGVLAYYWKGIEEFPWMRPIPVTLWGEGFRYQEEILFVLILNGRSAGGFRKIGPFASVNDGLLDVCIFKACPVIEMMPLMIQLMNGEHVNNPNLIYFQTPELFITCDEEIGTDLDGERGFRFPAHIRCIPQRLKVLTRYHQESGFEGSTPYRFRDVKWAFSKSAADEAGDLQVPEVKKPSANAIAEALKELPQYQTDQVGRNHTLGEAYYEAAGKTMNTGYVYLVISCTGPLASEGSSRRNTCSAYISFDSYLETIIGYDGGDHVYSPGLSEDMIEYFSKKPDANILIYRLAATRTQKKKMLDAVRKMTPADFACDPDACGTLAENCETCSFSARFVYEVLKAAKLTYFEKNIRSVTATDFIELDYGRRLEYCGTVFQSAEDEEAPK